jgi:hypothetical protein
MGVALPCRLELDSRPAGMLAMSLWLVSKEGARSFLVDEIGGVVKIEETTFESPPRILKGGSCGKWFAMPTNARNVRCRSALRAH